jgi:hypothetical protein
LAFFDRARRALISRVDALGELYTRNWDKEPLPVLYDADARRPSYGDYVRSTARDVRRATCCMHGRMYGRHIYRLFIKQTDSQTDR